MNYSESESNYSFVDVLTVEEEARRKELELAVEKSFVQAGFALLALKEERLYRSTHSNFQNYCRERFGYLNRRHPNYLINAAKIYQNLDQKKTENKGTNGSLVELPLPTSERQCRPLSKLDEDDDKWSAWLEAINEAGGKVPSAKIVKSAVDRIREKHRIPLNFHPGEVYQIIIKENPDLRGRSGEWCIIKDVHEFSCSVQFWDGIFHTPLKPEHFKPMNFTEQEEKERQELAERLAKIPLDQVDMPLSRFLSGLGKLQRPYLLPLEEQVLALIESNLNLS